MTLRGVRPKPKGYPSSPRTLADHLLRRRLDLGLPQGKVARQLGVNCWTYGHWEAGHLAPKRRSLVALAEFLGDIPSVSLDRAAERLAALRLRHGGSLPRLALLLKVKKQTVARWEAGLDLPTRVFALWLEAWLKTLESAR